MFVDKFNYSYLDKIKNISPNRKEEKQIEKL